MSKKTATTDAEFKIETGVKVPASRRGGGSEKYPISQLQIGESFFVKRSGSTFTQLQNNLCNCTIGYAKRHNPKAKFTTRQMDGGVRVWRVK